MSDTQGYKISHATKGAALVALYVRRMHVNGYIKDLEAGAPANEGETVDQWKAEMERVVAAIRELENLS